MRQFCRTNIHNNPWLITALCVLTCFGVVFVSVRTYVSNSLSLLSLPSSPWSWTSSLYSSFSNFTPPINLPLSSEPPSPRLPENPNTALYSFFKSEKMNRVVNDLIKELETESMSRRGKQSDKKMEMIEAGLAGARALIKDSGTNNRSRPSSLPPYEDNYNELEPHADYVPHGEIYRNPNLFHRSYLLMEKMFKIYIYEEGDPPLFHYGPCRDIYSIEGIFLNTMETNTRFRTRDPDQAHVFFLPFSVVMILEQLFDPIIRDKGVLQRVIEDYIKIISTKYSYWNRSLGSDHFMLSCHDWGPRATWYVYQLYFTSIRVLCNANTSEFFNPRKDASIPEINLKTGEINRLTGGLPSANRTILAFFAGGLHGRIRPALFTHWKGKDENILIYERVPKAISYEEMMKKSKFCICPSGHEVASPRIVEAIYAECVPILISQDYVLPFSDVLNWDAFSVRVTVDEIPDLKKILMGVSEDDYVRMQANVRQVQRHFLVNDPPKRYDVFHMILHSIWLRRLNLQINR